MHSKSVIEQLIEIIVNTPPEKKLPGSISDRLIMSKEIVLELLSYYLTIKNTEPKKLDACLILIARSLDELRYSLDRKEQNAKDLFNKVQNVLSEIFSKRKQERLVNLNAVLYESLLPFTLNLNDDFFKTKKEDQPDIAPKIPELLETLKRKNNMRSGFDLYDGLMSQMQMRAVPVQLLIIRELIASFKRTSQEVAILMLLHTKSEIRHHTAKILAEYISKNFFTSLDLRRLILIRNWLTPGERNQIDHLIKGIRLQKVSSASYTPAKMDRIVSSAFDGAGAQLILFLGKQGSNRVTGGFILKQGIGIRDPWINLRSAKGEFEAIIDNCKMELKPITIAYITKAVRHFLAEGHKQGNVPSPIFLQIAEMIGPMEWQPESINIRTELERLYSKSDVNLNNPREIVESLERSGCWDRSESFFSAWLECGDFVNQTLKKEIIEYHHRGVSSDALNLEAVVIKTIIQPMIEKWKTIFIFTCLWARSKVIKAPLWKDLMILIVQLESGKVSLTDIPAIKNIAKQTVLTFFARVNLDS